jgi:hypothetical protein
VLRGASPPRLITELSLVLQMDPVHAILHLMLMVLDDGDTDQLSHAIQ